MNDVAPVNTDESPLPDLQREIDRMISDCTDIALFPVQKGIFDLLNLREAIAEQSLSSEVAAARLLAIEKQIRSEVEKLSQASKRPSVFLIDDQVMANGKKGTLADVQSNRLALQSKRDKRLMVRLLDGALQGIQAEHLRHLGPEDTLTESDAKALWVGSQCNRMMERLTSFVDQWQATDACKDKAGLQAKLLMQDFPDADADILQQQLIIGAGDNLRHLSKKSFNFSRLRDKLYECADLTNQAADAKIIEFLHTAYGIRKLIEAKNGLWTELNLRRKSLTA